jgi:hypothetical protein
MSASQESQAFNPAKAEAFAGRFMTVLNDGALCLMTSVGHRTGLFDAMRAMPPSTSAEIATRAGLNERYVREWLGAMTTGGCPNEGGRGRQHGGLRSVHQPARRCGGRDH